MRRGHLAEFVALVAAMVVTNVATAGADTELKLRDAWLSGLAGYDSNVRRVSSSNPPPGLSDSGDARFILNGGLQAALRSGRFQGSLELRPYYVTYAKEDVFDRADIYATPAASLRLFPTWTLEGVHTLRHVNFPDRSSWNQTYTNTRLDLRRRFKGRGNAAVHYRYLYRDRPSPNLDWVDAHGIGASALVHAVSRVSISAMGRYDWETAAFVFPGSVDGRRIWADVSLRYQFSRNIIVLGKYLYQDDETDFPFDSGRDFDKLGEGSEAASDDILQSIRFLEDRDFNYHKNLFVAYVISRVGERHLFEGFTLVQTKRLDQLVLSLPERPKRRDSTMITQFSYGTPLARTIRLFGYVRFERSKSNDPDQEFDLFTGGVGLKWSPAAAGNKEQ